MANKIRFAVADEIAEKNDWEYRCTIQDTAGQPILAVSIDTLTLTLYDVATGAIINGVDKVNIRGVGRGTLGDSNGSLVVHFYAADSPIVGTTAVGAKEAHIALIECTYNGGLSAWRREVYHRVTNLGKVT